MKLGQGARTDRLIAIDAARHDASNRGLHRLHHSDLHAGRVRAKHKIRSIRIVDEECVLHITSRMIVGEV